MLDVLKLVRPLVAAMVLFAMACSAWAVSDGSMPWEVLLHGVVGTALLVAGAVAFNQRIEASGDAQMERTSDRPVASGRMSLVRVNVYATVLTLAGLAYLWVLTTPAAALLGAISWLLYVCVYTPLKSVSPWQTPVGAVAGAMPMLMGAALAGKPTSTMAILLFGIVFLWQHPHAMAIAWRYRRQFEKAGVKLATVVDPTGRSAGRVAIVGAILLLAWSTLPTFAGLASPVYAAVAVVLGLIYLFESWQFMQRPSGPTCVRLQRYSLVYLPALLVMLLVSKV